MGPRPQCYIPSHKVIGPLVLEKKTFEGFYHIRVWWPSWSCDPDSVNKLSFPHPIEAPYEIWLLLAQWFWRKRPLKMVDGWTNDEPWLYYKLTNDSKGSSVFEVWFYTIFFMIKYMYMYIAPGQGQTTTRAQNFDVNRKALSLQPFVANFKEISL